MSVLALPYWALMVLFVATAVGLGCGGHAIVRHYVPYADLIEHNDVAGFMIAIVGVIYAVLLAFVVVVVWQQYDASDANYGSEASEVANVHAYARSLPPASAHEIQTLTHRYVREMIDDEWPAMRDGRASTAATATLARMFVTVNAVVPHGEVEDSARARLVESVQRLFDLRNRRLADNETSLPPVLWGALLVGAAITVGFGYLFGVVNVRVQFMMTGAVAALIGVMFVLLVELDFPFQRDSAISPGRWLELEHYLDITGDALAPLPEPIRRPFGLITRTHRVPGQQTSTIAREGRHAAPPHDVQ